MSRVFITGSTDGLGRAAARALLNDGHEVVLHARSQQRTSAFADLAPRSAGVVGGDLTSAVDTRSVAEQVNAIGRMDAVIHNAGTYSTSGRSPTPEGHAAILAVNTLAPYMLTAVIERPNRLISSPTARSGTSGCPSQRRRRSGARTPVSRSQRCRARTRCGGASLSETSCRPSRNSASALSPSARSVKAF